jgi:hypothetical protein
MRYKRNKTSASKTSKDAENSLVTRIMRLEFERSMLKTGLRHAKEQRKSVKKDPKFRSELKRLMQRTKRVKKDLDVCYGLNNNKGKNNKN